MEDHSKSTLVSITYRYSRGNSIKVINTMNNLFKKIHKYPWFLVEDLNLNSLDYSKSPPATIFFNLGFQHTIFPLFNRPTRVAKTIATAIDHIMTNTFLQAEISSGIIKTEISDHFPIFATMKIIITENRKQM